MKRLLLLFLPLCLSAQTSYFTALYDTTLAGAAGVSSIQQPPTPQKTARLIGFEVYSSVDTVLTLEQGNKATSTASSAIAPIPVGQTMPPTLLFFIASNSPAATTPINKWRLTGGTSKTVMFTEGSGSGTPIANIGRVPNSGYTLRSSATTGDFTVTWFWSEE